MISKTYYQFYLYLFYHLFCYMIDLSCNPVELGFEPFKSRTQRAVQKFRTGKNLETTQDTWVNFVADLKPNIWFISFISGDHLIFFLSPEFLGRDNADVFLFVENLAIGNICFNDLLQIGEPT